ncbi:unnamed protein product [Ascophyllum nodosum]
MASPLDPFLSANSFVVLDGGLGSELEAQGADLSDHLWSASLLVSNPSLIRETHLAYYQAGADVVTSASYQASVEGFRRKGIDEGKAKELILLSVKLAVEARDYFWQEHQQRMLSADVPPLPHQVLSSPHSRSRATDNPKEPGRGSDFGVDVRLRPLVAASIGCYGAAQADGSEYRGDYGARIGLSGLKEWYRQQLNILVGADGVDLFMFETIPCLEEARAALSLLEASKERKTKRRIDFSPRIKAVISVSCKDSQHLRSGENLRDFASLIWKRKAAQGSSSGGTFTPPEGLVGVGVNCVSPTCVKEALQTIAEVAQASVIVPGVESVDDARPPDIALVAYPNSGEEWDSVSRKWLPGTGLEGRSCPSGVEEFGRFARDEWWVAGARVIGGCCRTRPAHIAELRKALSAAARDARYQSS